MTSVALSIWLVSAGANGNANLYPLAAALVLDGKLAIADVPTRKLSYIPLDGLTPEQADLSFDRQHIVVSATDGDSQVTHLYLVDVATGQHRKLPAGNDGRQSFPRFADDGTAVVFTASAATSAAQSTDRVRKLRIADGTVEDIPGQPKESNRTPVSWDATRVAYVTTGSDSKPDLHVETVATEKQRVMAHLSGLSTELTTSPDHKKLVYTNRENGKLKFYLAQGKSSPKALAAVTTDADAVQPRFVCPRDVLFVNDKKVWVLNSDTGLVAELDGFNEATGEPFDVKAATADIAK